MIVVPEAFAQNIGSRFGVAGRAWLHSLPEQVESLCAAWRLTIDGQPMHGTWGLALAVRGAALPAVLKLTWPDDSGAMQRAVTALTLWDGRGAVRLLRADLQRHALLLERLDAARTLESVEIETALNIAGTLLRRLAAPAPADFPTLTALGQQLAVTLPQRWERQGRPLPARVIERAVTLAQALAPSSGRCNVNWMVNWDLHAGNVLQAEREPWLVIDPQLLAGDLEYGLAQLLWWRLEDIETRDGVLGGVLWALDTLVRAASLNTERARAWAYVRTVDYWLMALGAGLTIDPPRCERVIAALE